MILSTFSIWLSTLIPLSTGHAVPLTTNNPPTAEKWWAPYNLEHKNAFHIFNALHSAVRQWGSSLNHNGMSFFPAVVPVGTLLYRGSKAKELGVRGMQWLAFEPEHAQQFADGVFRPPKRVVAEDQKTLHNAKDGTNAAAEKSGFLHTYVTRRDLHLLYIDGMSGGKTLNGTLDSQDLILLNVTNPPPFWEYGRGEGLCEIARDDWRGRVDGFLRMEAGFEVILCEFEGAVTLRDVGRSSDQSVMPLTLDGRKGLKYLRAVADRFRGIGGGRVKINYEKMVSAFTLQTDLFPSGEHGPRLTNVSSTNLRALKKKVDEMILAEPSPFTHLGTDWQSIADMVVTRYSTRLKYLTLPSVFSNETILEFSLNELLSPFIDYDHRSFTDENLRCTQHLFPSTAYELPTAYLAKSAVNRIVNFICYSLVSTQHGPATRSLEMKQEVIMGLVEKLDWTTWKECGACEVSEICSIPLWPFGSEEDWVRPRCRGARTIHEQRGYWGAKARPWD